MITLITGGPGLGKTALAVDLIQTEYSGRTLFTNVRGLTIEHVQLPKVEELTIQKTNFDVRSPFDILLKSRR